MNIDYARIIETANKRKETLQELEALLTTAPVILSHAATVLDYLQKLHNVYSVLDNEGRLLIPEPARKQFANIPLTFAKGVVDGRQVNNGDFGLRQLIRALGT